MAKTTQTPEPVPAPQPATPAQGGSYVVQEDGSYALVVRTEEPTPTKE